MYVSHTCTHIKVLVGIVPWWIESWHPVPYGSGHLIPAWNETSQLLSCTCTCTCTPTCSFEYDTRLGLLSMSLMDILSYMHIAISSRSNLAGPLDTVNDTLHCHAQDYLYATSYSNPTHSSSSSHIQEHVPWSSVKSWYAIINSIHFLYETGIDSVKEFLQQIPILRWVNTYGHQPLRVW